MELAQLESHFVDIGGQFLTSAYDMSQKMKHIKAFVFDWDGVFNAGFKGEMSNSDFSEVDSMGVNLLRFAHYLERDELPISAVISGADNPSARAWARREKIQAVYSVAKDKTKALEHFCQAHSIEPKNVAFFFDDVQDLGLAQKVGLRFVIGRLANPLLLDFVEKKHLADYISSAQGNEHAIRECTELAGAICHRPAEVFSQAMNKEAAYRSYLQQRQSVSTEELNIN